MRFMVLIKANKDYEAGLLPDARHLDDLVKFNAELGKAGVLLAVHGLHPTSRGTRVRFSQGQRTTIDGPFTETKELIAGYWLWQVSSKEEAIEWLERAPLEDTEVEIRQVLESEDLGVVLAPEPGSQDDPPQKASGSHHCTQNKASHPSSQPDG